MFCVFVKYYIETNNSEVMKKQALTYANFIEEIYIVIMS